MHQHPRPPPVTASPASSPRTNPARTNNPRDEGPSQHSRQNLETEGYNEEGEEGSEDSGPITPNGPSRESVKKMDQILQVKSSPHHSQGLGAYLTSKELFLESRTRYPSIANTSPYCHIEGRDQKSEQMGRSLVSQPPPFLVEQALIRFR
jgi:hypothetical protein